jgi:hypothetical protein
MGIRAYLGNIAISQDSEHSDWYVEHLFIETMGDRLAWFEENYPNVAIIRRTLNDVAAYQQIHEWYAVFDDSNGLAHYKLTFG